MTDTKTAVLKEQDTYMMVFSIQGLREQVDTMLNQILSLQSKIKSRDHDIEVLRSEYAGLESALVKARDDLAECKKTSSSTIKELQSTNLELGSKATATTDTLLNEKRILLEEVETLKNALKAKGKSKTTRASRTKKATSA